MENFIFYRISDGEHAGSASLKSLWGNAPANPTNVQLEAQGIVKVEIPEDKVGQSVLIRYIDGKAIARFDQPPYWDEFISGLARNPFYQRVNLLRETNLAIATCVSRISTDVFVLNQDVDSFRWSFDRLIKALAAANAPITTQERANLAALVVRCGFPASAIDPIPEPAP